MSFVILRLTFAPASLNRKSSSPLEREFTNAAISASCAAVVISSGLSVVPPPAMRDILPPTVCGIYTVICGSSTPSARPYPLPKTAVNTYIPRTGYSSSNSCSVSHFTEICAALPSTVPSSVFGNSGSVVFCQRISSGKSSKAVTVSVIAAVPTVTVIVGAFTPLAVVIPSGSSGVNMYSPAVSLSYSGDEVHVTGMGAVSIPVLPTGFSTGSASMLPPVSSASEGEAISASSPLSESSILSMPIADPLTVSALPESESASPESRTGSSPEAASRTVAVRVFGSSKSACDVPIGTF